MIYHGLWNLSSEGALWWKTSSGLPVDLRILVGGAEIASSLSLVLGPLRRLSAAGIALLMLGAIPQHWSRGFSFKNGGWESPFVYLLLALAIAFNLSPNTLNAKEPGTRNPTMEKT